MSQESSDAEIDADETGTEADTDGTAADPSGNDDVETTADLADRLAEIDAVDDDLVEEVSTLEARAADLESALSEARDEVEELTSKLKRKQADFQNYKKRSKKKQQQIRERATEDLVERLVSVRDNLLRALDQEDGADIRPGVESTLAEFDRVLEDEDVTPIEPDPGTEVDPHRHEVMLRVDADQPEGTVVDVYQPGYEMADKVIRAAQVTVSDGDHDE